MNIAHFTDVHFTRNPADFPLRALLSKRGVGWLNLTLMRRVGRFRQVSGIVRALIDDLQQNDFDHILFTGDLTAVAFREEFESAAKAFQSLRDDPRVIGMPGNHDVYVRSARGQAAFLDLFPKWCRSDRPDLSLPGETWPLVRYLGDDWAVIALTGTRPCALADSSGLVGQPRLAAIEAMLKDPELQRRRIIMALHYGLMLENGQPDKVAHGLRDARELLDLARFYDVDLITHGHIHHRFVVPKGIVSPVAIANPGSLTDRKYDRSYHVYELNDDAITIKVRRFNDLEGRFEDWPEASGTGELPLTPRELQGS